ncbi:MAG: ribosome assembly RNA-binding protein YhbY [Methylobacter sp.]|nr:MAG: ribosome assembly RNA-binding protein YhbY [Methylobacter sp.]PPD02998.1 MAG: ribosome assembly RNA-binding protein YhbY [Methylobacter sp.]PPD23899.1 MAG: ribosome assembly RNA-binding protein YhbY [Methylobacter sp.]
MNNLDKKKLKASAHKLKPVVMVGQSGLTQGVMNEVDMALNAHELIKVRIRAERDERKIITEEICSGSNAELVQQIGQISIIYRQNPVK